MTTKRRLQVFVSSTYTDLKDERQAAVAAILKAGHIPAGMELFTAGDESQMVTIKRWIDESDVYMLILGGRYGSIEKSSGLSYTELEFDYAVEKNKPLFSVVVTETALKSKVKDQGSDVLELEAPLKLKDFRSKVLSNIASFFDDEKDIKLSVHESLSDFANNRELKGWVAAGDVQDTAPLYDQIERLSSENFGLREKISQLERSAARRSGTVEYDDMFEVLRATKIDVPPKLNADNKKQNLDVFSIFYSMHERFATGIANEPGMSELDQFLYFLAGPKLMVHGLVDIEKIAGVRFRRMITTRSGQLFLAEYERRKVASEKLKKLDSKAAPTQSVKSESTPADATATSPELSTTKTASKKAASKKAVPKVTESSKPTAKKSKG